VGCRAEADRWIWRESLQKFDSLKGAKDFYMEHVDIEEKDINVFQNQNHFAGFEGFVPTATNTFGDEFEQLASLQGWAKGVSNSEVQTRI
jgi:hypothetical protein